jgi:hypothetical protein
LALRVSALVAAHLISFSILLITFETNAAAFLYNHRIYQATTVIDLSGSRIIPATFNAGIHPLPDKVRTRTQSYHSASPRSMLVGM